MKDRWRDRLRGLDDVEPSPDLFDRAKAGPMLPDEHIPLPSTWTRAVAAIAAFAVFALAISLFAIPALRLREGAGRPRWHVAVVAVAHARRGT